MLVYGKHFYSPATLDPPKKRSGKPSKQKNSKIHMLIPIPRSHQIKAKYF